MTWIMGDLFLDRKNGSSRPFSARCSKQEIRCGRGHRVGELPCLKELMVQSLKVRDHFVATLVCLNLEIMPLVKAVDKPFLAFKADDSRLSKSLPKWACFFHPLQEAAQGALIHFVPGLFLALLALSRTMCQLSLRPRSASKRVPSSVSNSCAASAVIPNLAYNSSLVAMRRQPPVQRDRSTCITQTCFCKPRCR